jgi:PAS domain S-box-containing protein
MKQGRAVSRQSIRQEAQARLQNPGSQKQARRTARKGVKTLLHELEVHQVELQMQNDDLRRTEIDLAKSRDRYRSLYDHAPFGYMTLEQDGTIVDANPTAADLLGLYRREAVGLRLSSFMDPEAADRFHLLRQDLMASGAKQRTELRLDRRDGSAAYVRLEMVLDGDADPPRMNAVVVDLSDLRRAAQEELRASEGRFRQIAERIEDVFFVREVDGVVSYVSPAFEKIWGRPVEWLAGRKAGWQDTIDPEDRARVATSSSRADPEAPVTVTYRIRRPDDAVRWVQSRTFPTPAVKGEGQRNIGVIRDITTERELEEQVRQAQKMEAVGTFAGGLAHNLRNALQAILASIGLARLRGIENPRAVEALARGVTATDKAVRLIDQLMTFSRKDEADVEARPLRLDDELRAIQALLAAFVGESILLDVQPGAPGAFVTADPIQLQQILLNLAANARDAMPRGGRLSIRTRETIVGEGAAQAHGVPRGFYALMTVQDTGVGMDAPTRARIFEPFFTTKGIGRGTGLGLSTVFALIRRLGGYIDVESEPGSGSTFSIVLPEAEGAHHGADYDEGSGVRIS